MSSLDYPEGESEQQRILQQLLVDYKEFKKYDDDIIEYILRNFEHPNDFSSVCNYIRLIVMYIATQSNWRGRVDEAKYSWDSEQMKTSLKGRLKNWTDMEIKVSYGEFLISEALRKLTDPTLAELRKTL